MLKDIRRILSVALLALFLGVSLFPLSFGANVTLTLNSSPITGVSVWYSTKPGGTSGGPFTTNHTVSVPTSDTVPPFPGIGAYTISYELYPNITGTIYVLSHFVVTTPTGSEKVGYKQDVVHCMLGEVDVGYLRESLFTAVTVEAVYVAISYGPMIDKLRFKVVRSPDATLIQMQTCEIDVATDLIRTGDIEKLDGDGFTITAAPGFHMGHIGINIRPDQTYKDPAHGSPEAGPILSDVNFRHALFHCYNQEEIVASIYKYIVTPVQSLVPPSQGGWVNPNVPKHPYNPGEPTATTVYPADHSSCGILRYGGYLYCTTHSSWAVPYDLDGDGTPGTNGAPGVPATAILDHDDELRRFVPGLRVFTPTYEVAPTSAEHGARFCEDCNRIGIPLYHDPREFAPYLDLVFGTEGVPGGEFDLYMVFWSLGRFPDHLYDMCHSTQDVRIVAGAYNSPGIHSDDLDEAVETIKFSLDHAAKMKACYDAQTMLYDPAYSDCAFSYLQLYSRIYFNAFKPGLKGIVNSPGYGSDILDVRWTALNMHWESGHPNERYHEIYTDKSLIIWCLGEIPERLNPCFAHTVYAVEIITQTLDGGLEVNPYTHEDLPWLAWDWEIEKWATEDEVDELLMGAVLGSHWYEDWPTWGLNWNMTSWVDEDLDGNLTIGDLVDFDHGPEYGVVDMTWDIKVESKECPYNEMKLSGTDPLLARPPVQINKTDMVGTMWHEEWPQRSRMWHVDAVDDPTKNLTRSQQIMLNGTWWHVDSVTVTLHLDKIPGDATIDKVVEFAGTGMKLLYWLRDDVYWQDGNLFTAQDAKFNWLFLRDNEIPRYMTMWEHLVDVATVGPDGEDHFKVVAYLNVTSQFLVYDFAGTMAMLPPPVWTPLDGKPLLEILGYDPSTNTTKPTGAGPWFGLRDGEGQPIAAVTQLYGTGPFIFEYYDPVGMYAEMHAFRDVPSEGIEGYFKATVKVAREKSEMFHAIGDADWDGEVGIYDLSRMGRSYGYFCWELGFDAQADVNQDNIVDMRDITMLAFFWGDLREYPYPQDP